MVAVILVTFFFFLLFFYLRRRQKFSSEDVVLGLKGPAKNWLFGNIHSLLQRRKQVGYDDSYNWYRELHQKFGPNFTLYYGKQLAIFISREEDIKEVFIQKFSIFSNRLAPVYMESSCLAKSLFFSAHSQGWKTCRTAISPSFSTRSVRSMFPIVEMKIERLLKSLDQKIEANRRFDIHEEFKALTLEVIAKVAFAIDSDGIANRNDWFHVSAKQFINQIDIEKCWIHTAGMFLQEFGWLWKFLYQFTLLSKTEQPLVEALNDLYERRVSGESHDQVDLLKLLLEKKRTNPISRQEIVENCFAVLLGGYDTSSLSLAYCSYLLANHPKVQQKLHEEIEQTKKSDGLDCDSIMKMEYLDAVYKENMRMYPPTVHGISRVCLEDTYIGSQFIPKDALVVVIPYTVHHDEANWENPDDFIPERFLSSYDKSSLKWIPFGVGPRVCVGMKLAEMEIKATLVRMLERYEIIPIEGEPKLVVECDGVIMKPRGEVCVELRKR